MDFEGAKEFILAKQREELPAHFFYHNVAHIEDVYRVSIELGKMESLSTNDQNLVSMAALFHDSGFISGSNNHEEVSCRFAQKYLPEFGFSFADIEIICQIILATRVYSQPSNLLEQIICDADLDYLGRDDFEIISSKLLKELLHFGLVKDAKEFDLKQIAFFEAHQYHTPTSQLWRNTKKAENLETIKARVLNNNSNEDIQ